MKSRFLVIVAVVVAVAAVYFLGVAPRMAAEHTLTESSHENARVIVRTIKAARGKANLQLTLPANLDGFEDTAIYARTNGYVMKWLADLGDKVKTGQLLAVIDSPEVDQQLNQARANLQQAKANLELARVTSQRWKTLISQNAVSQQDADSKLADEQARIADTAAAEANVQRLEQLKGFERVVAPFDGVISARNIDIGNLVSAGAGMELFHLSESSTLRVYVDVPQAYAGLIHEGVAASVTVPEQAEKSFPGKVVRVAGALNPVSRTLRTEVQIPNKQGQLLAGTYCELHFSFAPSKSTLLIPSNDIIFRSEGIMVATVDAKHHLHLQHVKLGRDFGNQIEILDGLEEGTKVVENPSDALRDGAEVEG